MPIEARIDCSTLSIYSKRKLNFNKNQIIIEQITITVPALLIKAQVLSTTSRPTYFIDGSLYSGSSDINEETSFVEKIFFIIFYLIYII